MQRCQRGKRRSCSNHRMSGSETTLYRTKAIRSIPVASAAARILAMPSYSRRIGGDAQLRQVAGMFARLCLQARLQFADRHRLAIPAELVGGIQAQLDRRWRFGAIDRAIGGLWQLHGNRPATIGAVTMKMINSTSITSTSGVTLMSASGPLLPALLNAMCRSLQPGRSPRPTLRRLPSPAAVACAGSFSCRCRRSACTQCETEFSHRPLCWSP